MSKAIQLSDYFISHAKAAYAEMGADPATEDAKHILKWIERRGATNVTKRDIHQGTKNRFRYINKLEPGLKILIDHEYIRERDQSTTIKRTPGRLSSPVFDINPAILSSKFNNNEIYEDNEDKKIKSKVEDSLKDKTETLSSKFPLSSQLDDAPKKGGSL